MNNIYVAGNQAAMESTADVHMSSRVQRTLDANVHSIYMRICMQFR